MPDLEPSVSSRTNDYVGNGAFYADGYLVRPRPEASFATRGVPHPTFTATGDLHERCRLTVTKRVARFITTAMYLRSLDMKLRPCCRRAYANVTIGGDAHPFRTVGSDGEGALVASPQEIRGRLDTAVSVEIPRHFLPFLLATLYESVSPILYLSS